MGYYSNSNDSNSCPTAGEFEEYPFLNEPSAIDFFHDKAHITLEERWGMIPQQGSSLDFLAGEANFRKYNHNHFIDHRPTRVFSISGWIHPTHERTRQLRSVAVGRL